MTKRNHSAYDRMHVERRTMFPGVWISITAIVITGIVLMVTYDPPPPVHAPKPCMTRGC